MNQHTYIPFCSLAGILLLACLLPHAVRSQVAFDTPLKAVDHFFETLGRSGTDPNGVLSETAMITSLRYDSAGNPSYLSYTPDSFRAELRNLSEAFQVTQEPVVIVYREYLSVASIFCSVWSQFIERSSADTLISRSIQSFKLVRLGDGWKINHLVIQNENPAYPLDAEMWPPEITALLTPRSGPGNSDTIPEGDIYDSTRVYTPDEVDEAPVYPGDGTAFENLLRTSNVTTSEAPGYKPFTIVIAEDGQAGLDNVEGLSNYQRAKATTFVRSMLAWYPAILDAASVKCKLTFYIRE